MTYGWSVGEKNDGFGFLSASFLLFTTHTLRQDETLRLRYRVLVFDGLRPAEQIDEAYRAYAG